MYCIGWKRIVHLMITSTIYVVDECRKKNIVELSRQAVSHFAVNPSREKNRSGVKQSLFKKNRFTKNTRRRTSLTLVNDDSENRQNVNQQITQYTDNAHSEMSVDISLPDGNKAASSEMGVDISLPDGNKAASSEMGVDISLPDGNKAASSEMGVDISLPDGNKAASSEMGVDISLPDGNKAASSEMGVDKSIGIGKVSDPSDLAQNGLIGELSCEIFSQHQPDASKELIHNRSKNSADDTVHPHVSTEQDLPDVIFSIELSSSVISLEETATDRGANSNIYVDIESKLPECINEIANQAFQRNAIISNIPDNTDVVKTTEIFSASVSTDEHIIHKSMNVNAEKDEIIVLNEDPGQKAKEDVETLVETGDLNEKHTVCDNIPEVISKQYVVISPLTDSNDNMDTNNGHLTTGNCDMPVACVSAVEMPLSTESGGDNDGDNVTEKSSNEKEIVSAGTTELTHEVKLNCKGMTGNAESENTVSFDKGTNTVKDEDSTNMKASPLSPAELKRLKKEEKLLLKKMEKDKTKREKEEAKRLKKQNKKEIKERKQLERAEKKHSFHKKSTNKCVHNVDSGMVKKDTDDLADELSTANDLVTSTDLSKYNNDRPTPVVTSLAEVQPKIQMEANYLGIDAPTVFETPTSRDTLLDNSLSDAMTSIETELDTQEIVIKGAADEKPPNVPTSSYPESDDEIKSDKAKTDPTSCSCVVTQTPAETYPHATPSTRTEQSKNCSSGELKRIELGPRLRTAILNKISGGKRSERKSISLTQPIHIPVTELSPPRRKFLGARLSVQLAGRFNSAKVDEYSKCTSSESNQQTQCIEIENKGCKEKDSTTNQVFVREDTSDINQSQDNCCVKENCITAASLSNAYETESKHDVSTNTVCDEDNLVAESSHDQCKHNNGSQLSELTTNVALVNPMETEILSQVNTGAILFASSSEDETCEEVGFSAFTEDKNEGALKSEQFISVQKTLSIHEDILSECIRKDNVIDVSQYLCNTLDKCPTNTKYENFDTQNTDINFNKDEFIEPLMQLSEKSSCFEISKNDINNGIATLDSINVEPQANGTNTIHELSDVRSESIKLRFCHDQQNTALCDLQLSTNLNCIEKSLDSKCDLENWHHIDNNLRSVFCNAGVNDPGLTMASYSKNGCGEDVGDMVRERQNSPVVVNETLLHNGHHNTFSTDNDPSKCQLDYYSYTINGIGHSMESKGK